MYGSITAAMSRMASWTKLPLVRVLTAALLLFAWPVTVGADPASATQKPAFKQTSGPAQTVDPTLYFAEGSTQPPFDTWFLIQNPTGVPANVQFTFSIQGAGTVTRTFVVGPTSRFSLFANQVIPNVAFSTRIDADQPVLAERAMYVSYDGDDVPGISSPNTTWLFAEGSTQNPFHTWYLLQNPNSTTASATITYMLLGGGTPVTQVVSLPPNSRTSIFVNQVLPNAAFSTQVTGSQPIIVERAMYRFPGNAATAVSGANAPSATWYFPNAKTSVSFSPQFPVPFDSFLLMLNPNSFAVSATVRLFRSNGQVVTVTQQLPANSRQTLFLNQVLPNTSFGVSVQASAPIVAERSMFFGTEPRGAMDIMGVNALRTTWNLAEGSTQSPFTENIYVLNPNSSSMSVHIDFQLPGGQVIGHDFTVGPTAFLTVPVNSLVPNSPVSARITTSLPSAVERQMFFRKLGSLGGTDATGIP